MMRFLRVLYLTIWLKVHPVTGPVSDTDPSPVLYTTWRQAYTVAQLITD